VPSGKKGGRFYRGAGFGGADFCFGFGVVGFWGVKKREKNGQRPGWAQRKVQDSKVPKGPSKTGGTEADVESTPKDERDQGTRFRETVSKKKGGGRLTQGKKETEGSQTKLRRKGNE